MRHITSKIIDDAVLKNYSFEGRGRKKDGAKKKPFKIYEHLVTFIGLTATIAFNEFNDLTPGFVKKTETEVRKHFKDNFLKYTEQRMKSKK